MLEFAERVTKLKYTYVKGKQYFEVCRVNFVWYDLMI